MLNYFTLGCNMFQSKQFEMQDKIPLIPKIAENFSSMFSFFHNAYSFICMQKA